MVIVRALVVFFILLLARSAGAHSLGVSRGEYRVVVGGVDAVMVFRTDEIQNALGAASRDDAAREIASGVRVDMDGVACKGALGGIADDPPDGVRITIHFSCGGGRHLVIHADFLERLAGGHAHVVRVEDASGARPDHLLVLANRDLAVDLAAAPESGFVSFLREGVFHILTGPDHLLFLFGLVLFRRDDKRNRARARDLVFVLTAFTIGHSISLATATLAGFAPPARVVEPLVALSVAWVGAENLFSKRDMRRRWLITFPFGLVHGFAFASGLLIVGLPRAELPRALLGFNLGVEAGQLAVMACILPLLFLLARKPLYDRVRAILSGGVVVAGLVWFVQRVFFV